MSNNLFPVVCVGAIGLFAMVAACGWGALMLSGVKSETALHDKLAYHGIQATAEVVDHHFTSMRGGNNYYYVTYRYDVKAPDGTVSQLTREAQVSSDTYYKLDIGTQVDTQYLPDDPKVSRFRGSIPENDSPDGMRAEAYRDIAIGIGIGVFFAFVIVLILTQSK